MPVRVFRLKTMKLQSTYGALESPVFWRLINQKVCSLVLNWLNSLSLDWALFIREGIPASVLEATGNEFCLQLAAKAREEAQ